MNFSQIQLNEENISNVDAVIIGAGFSGLYMLHRLRKDGYSTRVFEAGDGVGGTWYWNRYPGARCDVDSIYYGYTFSEEIYKEWTWSSRYAEQPEILQYANFVADKLDLRKDIQFNTRVVSAHFNEESNRWAIKTDDGSTLLAKFFITGVGCLSAGNVPNFKGLDQFEGEWYHTGGWPHEKVDFKGKRVGVIGTGSTGIQAIPAIAKEARHLFVFQRTPQYSIPAKNYPYSPDFIQEVKNNFEENRKLMRTSFNGIPITRVTRSGLEDTPEQRQLAFEKAFEKGGFFTLMNTYNDILRNEKVNYEVANFVRSKIKERLGNDTSLIEKLLPTFHYGTKRPIIDTDYYETYKRENVTLVDIKKSAIQEITANGLCTLEQEYDLDILVFATGYDAMTGSLLKMDIRGKNGVSLKEQWANGVQTYLGLSVAGFPNMFTITGPQSPSVLTNMILSIEQGVEWISDCLNYLRDHEIDVIEATKEEQEAWSKHCREIADNTLYNRTDSWFLGANIEGKPRQFLIYLGGLDRYRNKCNEVAANGYKDFALSKSKKLV